MISTALRSVRDALTVAEEQLPIVSFELPLRLDSVANGGQGASMGWRFWKAKETKNLRSIGRATATAAIQKQTRMHATRLLLAHKRLVVLITRIAPRELDRADNLPRSCKAVIDSMADALGINDRDARVEFLVDQTKRSPKEYAVKVEIYDSH